VLGRRGFLGAASLLACGAPGPRPSARRTSGPRLPETRETLEALIAAWRAESPIVGLSLALVCDGELVWAGGHGWADREAGLPASEASVYAIGSLTKPYTALTALRAVAAGQLDLDAPIREHLPALRTGGAMADRITARQLLCHRSGLPSEWHRDGMGVAPPPWTDIVDELRDEPVIAAPDSWTAYSNVGYTLLAHALTRATGRPFEVLLAEAMTAELGAAAPSFGAPAALAAYAEDQRMVEPRLRHAPAAGLHASVLDMVPLLRFLASRRPIATAMLSPQRAGPLDFDECWGLGLAMRHAGLDYGGRAGFHVGRTVCHRSALGVLPDHGLAVVVLANSREATGVEQVAITALQTALLERHGIDLPPTRGDAEALAPITADPAALRAHAGRYVGDNDIVEVAVEGAALVSRSEIGEVALTPAADGCFTSSGNPDVRVRVRAVAGRHVITSRLRAVEHRVAVRCLEGHVPEAWWRRLGRYRVVAGAGELLAFRTAALERIGDTLTLRFETGSPGGPAVARLVLDVRDEHEARIDGIGRGKGQRVAAEDRGGELYWAGYRMVREA
jgi:CubicO group peptidase (beta-lactamase class C family)